MTVMAVLARHPNWSECPVCGRLFTAEQAFTTHMTSGTSRTCRDPSRVRLGSRRLAFDEVYGAWRWQTGDRPPPARRTPPPRHGGRARRAGGAPGGSAGWGRPRWGRLSEGPGRYTGALRPAAPRSGRRHGSRGDQHQGPAVAMPLFDASDHADVDPVDLPELPTEQHQQLYRLLCANAHRDKAGRLVTWWPQTDLAAKLGIKPRQLRNLLADLREPGSDPRHPTTRPPGLRLGLVKVEPTSYRDRATGRHRLGGNLYVLVEQPRQQAMAEEPVSPAQVNRQWHPVACLNEEPPASEERRVSTPTVSNADGGHLFDAEDLDVDNPQRWIAPQHAGTVAW